MAPSSVRVAFPSSSRDSAHFLGIVVLRFEMQSRHPQGVLDWPMALIEPRPEVQQVCNQVGDFAAVALEPVAFGLNVLLQNCLGAVGAALVGGVGGHGVAPWFAACSSSGI